MSRAFFPAMVLAVASVHCAQVLGADYCKADDPDCPSASSSSGQGGGIGGEGAIGGAAGEGGSGGASGVMQCAVVPNTIQEMASLMGEGPAFQWEPRIEVADVDDDAIVYLVARAVSGDGDHLEIYRHGRVGRQRDVAMGGHMLAAAGHGASERALFLFQQTATGQVRLVELSYDSPTLTTLVSVAVDPAAFTHPVDSALIAPMAGGAVGILFSTTEGADPRAYFALYAGTVAVPGRFTLPGGLNAHEVRPLGLLESGSGSFFAFIGGPGASVDIGTRLYDLSATPTQLQPAATFPLGLHLVHAAALGQNHLLAVEDASRAGTFILRSATLPPDGIIGAAPDAFPVAGSVPDATFPADSWRWTTRSHVMFMGIAGADPKIGEAVVLSYTEGLQATATLDLGASVTDHDRIDTFMLRPRDAFPAAPALDGVAMTEHGGFKKLFTFELACTTPR